MDCQVADFAPCGRWSPAVIRTKASQSHIQFNSTTSGGVLQALSTEVFAQVAFDERVVLAEVKREE